MPAIWTTVAWTHRPSDLNRGNLTPGVVLCQVYRGKWCGIDIAAKEYLGGDEDSELQGSGEQSDAGRLRAQVSTPAAAFCSGSYIMMQALPMSVMCWLRPLRRTTATAMQQQVC